MHPSAYDTITAVVVFKRLTHRTARAQGCNDRSCMECSSIAFMQAHCAQLQMERGELLIRVNSTPDRCRADKQLLQAQAKK